MLRLKINMGDNSPSHQSDGHEYEQQRHMMKDQHQVLDEESPHCLQRVTAVHTATTSDPLRVVVGQIHGKYVKGHVWSSKQNKCIDQPVTVFGQTDRQYYH